MYSIEENNHNENEEENKNRYNDSYNDFFDLNSNRERNDFNIDSNYNPEEHEGLAFLNDHHSQINIPYSNLFQAFPFSDVSISDNDEHFPNNGDSNIYEYVQCISSTKKKNQDIPSFNSKENKTKRKNIDNLFQLQNENAETNYSSLIKNKSEINKFFQSKISTLNKVKKLSGRKRKTEIKEGDFIHNKNAVDNIERKLKCHSINSLIDATNELISLKFNQKYKFLKILYALIKDVSEKEMNSLKQRSIGEILQQEISKKYSKRYPNNENIYEIVKKDKDIKEFLNKIYIDIFRNNYYANNKRIKFGDSYIELKKMKTLEDFFREKNLNNEEDKKRVNEVIEKKYLTSKMKILKSKN